MRIPVGHYQNADLRVLAASEQSIIVLRVKMGEEETDCYMSPSDAEKLGVCLCKVADEMRALKAAAK